MSSTVSLVQQGPNPTLMHTFSYLEKAEFTAYSSVCKSWNTSAKKEILERALGKIPEQLNVDVLFKAYVPQILKSNREIVNCVQAFASRVSLGQNARLTVVIRSGTHCPGLQYQTISILIKGSNDGIAFEQNRSVFKNELPYIDFRETYFAVNDIGDRSLPTPPRPIYAPKGYRVGIGMFERHIRIYGSGNVHALLSCPEPHDPTLEKGTELEDRIKSILATKLTEFEDQQSLGTRAKRTARHFLNLFRPHGHSS